MRNIWNRKGDREGVALKLAPMTESELEARKLQLGYFIKSTERARLISWVILR
jgi:hypothetical protein